MTPDQWIAARKHLGWSRQRLSIESGVALRVLEHVEVPRRVTSRVSPEDLVTLRKTLVAAGAPLPEQTANVRVIGLRPPVAKTDGTPERNRHVDVEVDGEVHDVRVKASNGIIRLFEPLLSHPGADLVKIAVAAYLESIPESEFKAKA